MMKSGSRLFWWCFFFLKNLPFKSTIHKILFFCSAFQPEIAKRSSVPLYPDGETEAREGGVPAGIFMCWSFICCLVQKPSDLYFTN